MAETTETYGSQWWRLEDWDQGLVLLRALFQDVDFSLCPHRMKRQQANSLASHWSHLWGLCPHDLLTPRKVHLWIPSHWGLGFQQRKFGSGGGSTNIKSIAWVFSWHCYLLTAPGDRGLIRTQVRCIRSLLQKTVGRRGGELLALQQLHSSMGRAPLLSQLQQLGLEQYQSESQIKSGLSGALPLLRI